MECWASIELMRSTSCWISDCRRPTMSDFSSSCRCRDWLASSRLNRQTINTKCGCRRQGWRSALGCYYQYQHHVGCAFTIEPKYLRSVVTKTVTDDSFWSRLPFYYNGVCWIDLSWFKCPIHIKLFYNKKRNIYLFRYLFDRNTCTMFIV